MEPRFRNAVPRVVGKQQRFVRKRFFGLVARYTVFVHALMGIASVPFETFDKRQNVHACICTKYTFAATPIALRHAIC